MSLKKYQPERPDLLINTEWGIPKDELSKDEAKSRGMKLFHKRWVNKEEKKQVQEEYNAYHTIRGMGYLLIAPTVIIFINIGEIAKSGVVVSALTVMFGLAMLAAGIGLIKFKRVARNIAVCVFLSFLVLPFTPLYSDDKGAPGFILLGVIGLYYLLRSTARKVFAPLPRGNVDTTKNKSPHVREAIIAIGILMAIFVFYGLYDTGQTSRMAADVCSRAIVGMPVEDYLSGLSEKDYRIIKQPDHVIIVPRRGMGRNYCTVSHDGRKITGSKTGYHD